MSSKWGGFLSDVAGFDADYFGISPREAEAMDPQQRLMLEVAYEALEHAGIATEDLSGVRAAVLMGVYYGEYQTISAANPDAIDAYSATGNAHAVAVGRIAYLLGLRGPAVAIDSACSSSLVTIHLACQSLRLRESDLALAGGVSLILRPETQIAMAKWGMLSPNGRRRIRPRRGLRRRGAQTADRRGARRGPGARRRAGLRGQSGRPVQWTDRAQHHCATRRDQERTAQRRRARPLGELHRSARHRHGAW
jgi:3-oxoacyl-(acyl-carrier-protein) synthase